MTNLSIPLLAIACLLSAADSPAQSAEEPGPEPRWWRGNLHTHTFWSDGDDFPEMVSAWYQDNGYHFLAISDHNVLHQAERWLTLGTNQLRHEALEKYVRRFGINWVETRETNGNRQVRLKPLIEYQPLFQVPGQFLLIQSEEISDQFEKLPIHLNASNIREFIPPQGGSSVREVMQNNVDAILRQAQSNGQPVLPHLNHPNFHWAITAEDLAAVRGERFFEVYNGHPAVNNAGDSAHASTERIWDIALVLRLMSAAPEPLYGIAVDDSHNYHKHGARFSNAGRGWIMVRARFLTPESLLSAMERGDFYASSGVQLREIKRTATEFAVEIDTQDGAQYRTEFIGTRRGFDSESHSVQDQDGKPLPVTRRYSPEVGECFLTVEGPRAVYRFKGDELYVRARVISSREQGNPVTPDDKEMAWTQPVFLVPLAGTADAGNRTDNIE